MRLRCADAVHRRREPAGGANGPGDADPAPSRRKRRRLSEHEPRNVRRFRTQRDAQADLARTLRDNECRHSVETRDGQNQRDDGKCAEQIAKRAVGAVSPSMIDCMV